MDPRQLAKACKKEDRDNTTNKMGNQKNYPIESAERGNLENRVGKILKCDTR